MISKTKNLNQQTKIFQEGFTTANSSGYGLYLIQKNLQAYGWTIKEEGTPNQGAKFTITIPNQQQQQKTTDLTTFTLITQPIDTN